MNKMIEQIYTIQTEEDPCLFMGGNRERIKREWALYDELYSSLLEKNKTLFLEYTNHCTERHAEELKNAYEKGFKAAIRLLAESMKE